MSNSMPYSGPPGQFSSSPMPMHIRNHPSVAYANQYNTPSEASSYGGGDNTRANTNTSEAGEIDSKHSIPNGYTPKMQGKVQRSFGYREMPRIPVFSAFRDAEEFHYANKVFADRMVKWAPGFKDFLEEVEVLRASFEQRESDTHYDWELTKKKGVEARFLIDDTQERQLAFSTAVVKANSRLIFKEDNRRRSGLGQTAFVANNHQYAQSYNVFAPSTPFMSGLSNGNFPGGQAFGGSNGTASPSPLSAMYRFGDIRGQGLKMEEFGRGLNVAAAPHPAFVQKTPRGPPVWQGPQPSPGQLDHSPTDGFLSYGNDGNEQAPEEDLNPSKAPTGRGRGGNKGGASKSQAPKVSKTPKAPKTPKVPKDATAPRKRKARSTKDDPTPKKLKIEKPVEVHDEDAEFELDLETAIQNEGREINAGDQFGMQAVFDQPLSSMIPAINSHTN